MFCSCSTYICYHTVALACIGHLSLVLRFFLRPFEFVVRVVPAREELDGWIVDCSSSSSSSHSLARSVCLPSPSPSPLPCSCSASFVRSFVLTQQRRTVRQRLREEEETRGPTERGSGGAESADGRTDARTLERGRVDAKAKRRRAGAGGRRRLGSCSAKARPTELRRTRMSYRTSSE